MYTSCRTVLTEVVCTGRHLELSEHTIIVEVTSDTACNSQSHNGSDVYGLEYTIHTHACALESRTSEGLNKLVSYYGI